MSCSYIPLCQYWTRDIVSSDLDKNSAVCCMNRHSEKSMLYTFCSFLDQPGLTQTMPRWCFTIVRMHHCLIHESHSQTAKPMQASCIPALPGGPFRWSQRSTPLALACSRDVGYGSPPATGQLLLPAQLIGWQVAQRTPVCISKEEEEQVHQVCLHPGPKMKKLQWNHKRAHTHTRSSMHINTLYFLTHKSPNQCMQTHTLIFLSLSFVQCTHKPSHTPAHSLWTQECVYRCRITLAPAWCLLHPSPR